MRDFDDILAIDPLYILLGPKIFELLHRPDPPPIDVITGRVQDAVKHMSAQDKVSVHTPGIDPARTEKVRELSRLRALLCWRGFAPINWCLEPAWERVRHGSWRGRLRGGTRKPSNLVGCMWR